MILVWFFCCDFARVAGGAIVVLLMVEMVDYVVDFDGGKLCC